MVSLGEIERTLLRHSGVRRAAALQLKGMLVACVECPDPDQTQEVDWREFLGRTLPSYMIPAQVAVLPEMPISSAGKVDRIALLKIADSVFEEAREQEAGTPPQGDLERMIAGIWEDVLGQRPIMRENNFFTVGGTSLMAIAVSQRLQLRGYNVTVQMVLASLTVAALAERIAAIQEQPSVMNDVSPVENIATTDQEGFWIASEIGLAPAASHIVRVLECSRSDAATIGMAIGMDPPDRSSCRPAHRVLFGRRTVLFAGEQLNLTNFLPHANFSFDRCESLEAPGTS